MRLSTNVGVNQLTNQYLKTNSANFGTKKESKQDQDYVHLSKTFSDLPMLWQRAPE